MIHSLLRHQIANVPYCQSLLSFQTQWRSVSLSTLVALRCLYARSYGSLCMPALSNHPLTPAVCPNTAHILVDMLLPVRVAKDSFHVLFPCIHKWTEINKETPGKMAPRHSILFCFLLVVLHLFSRSASATSLFLFFTSWGRTCYYSWDNFRSNNPCLFENSLISDHVCTPILKTHFAERARGGEVHWGWLYTSRVSLVGTCGCIYVYLHRYSRKVWVLTGKGGNWSSARVNDFPWHRSSVNQEKKILQDDAC